MSNTRHRTQYPEGGMAMKGRSAAAWLLVSILSIFFLGGSAVGGTLIRMQSVYPEKSYGPELLKVFAEKAKEYSGGEVEFKLFWPGQLVSAEEGLDALGKGMIEGLYAASIYYGGTIPEAKVEWLPFNWKDAKDAVEIYTKRGFLAKMREFAAKHDAYYLCPILVGSMGAMTKFPVSKIEDFKGKKIRATGVDGPIAQALGAAPVALVGPEAYTALKTGTIEGTIYPYYTIKTYKFHEVLDHIILPPFHPATPTVVWINLKVWEKLSPKAREALERAGVEILELSAKKSEEWDAEAVDFAKQQNVKVMTLPEGEVKKMKDLFRPIWDKVAEASPGAKELIKILDDFYKGK